jgi:sulfite exporter TauE/SafE/copper chaperone CopZ/plastocyanin domain-containing protein
MQTQTIRIDGMTCINCQNRIEKKLKSLAGIENAAVDYADGTAKVTYDEAVIARHEILNAVESLGYTTSKENSSGNTALQIIGVLAVIIAIAFLLKAFSTSSIAASFPLAEEGMGYGMLLVIGLFTSVHCIAMCGGINLSQSLTGGNAKSAVIESTNAVSKSKLDFSLLLPGVLYNGGRLVSYTAVGFAVGALGSVFTVSDLFRNIVLLLAGLLMAIMGINMLGLFPAFRRFTQGFEKSGLSKFFAEKIGAQKTGRGPLVIGFLNGFMPCGPLQAMQLYALSTASPIKGGVSMFLFCLGTVPLMFALGAAGGVLSGAKGSAFSRRAMQVGAVLVAAMGVVMFTNGWSGAGFDRANPLAGVSMGKSRASDSVIRNGVQIINSTLLPNRYPAITVQQGIPVRWTINAPRGSINGCNNRFIIREYGIQHAFKYGDNVIEFTPEKAGRFSYSCWMSMIRSSITVLAPGESIADLKEPDVTPKPAGVAIPTDAVAVARIEDGGKYQSVEINLTDDGFEPAIAAVQQGLPVLWTINIISADPGNSSIIFPAYYTQIETEQGANQLQLLPTEDFDFSTADNVFYGYVKVVNDINNVNVEAIKAEVENHETLIYPDAYFERELW